MVRVIGQFRWIDWFESEKETKKIAMAKVNYRLFDQYHYNNFLPKKNTYISFSLFSNVFIGFQIETD